jgi:hypothetical protein
MQNTLAVVLVHKFIRWAQDCVMHGYRGRGAADAAVHGCNELAAVGCNMSARSSVWFCTGVMASLCASVMLLM